MTYQEFQLHGQRGRLDKILTDLIPYMSRSSIQKLIEADKVRVNDKLEKANFKLQGDELIQVEILEEKSLSVEGQNIPLDIVYEDDYLLVVNKSVGIVVHPSKGHPNGTLVNGLVYYLGQDLSEGSESYRPGLVHRIDKDTSGLVVIAKTNQAHNYLSQQLIDKTMHREYIALVNGYVEADQATIEVPIRRDANIRTKFTAHADGKYALSEFEVLERFQKATLVKVRLKTGRTHQIRVHMEYIGHPLVGDPLYRQGLSEMGGRLARYNQGQFLHAYKIELKHPRDEKLISFEVDLPLAFEELLTTLR